MSRRQPFNFVQDRPALTLKGFSKAEFTEMEKSARHKESNYVPEEGRLV
jgi:hypothetical protein